VKVSPRLPNKTLGDYDSLTMNTSNLYRELATKLAECAEIAAKLAGEAGATTAAHSTAPPGAKPQPGRSESGRAILPNAGDNVLWTIDNICTYLGIEKTKLRSFSCMPNFPKAIRLPSDKGSGHPRYRSEEVVKWAGKHQEKN